MKKLQYTYKDNFEVSLNILLFIERIINKCR
jgi:hypothetical protein